MTWYPLRDTVQPFLGERLTTLFAHAVSTRDRLPHLFDVLSSPADQSGENPDALVLNERGADRSGVRPTAAKDAHQVSDAMYADLAAGLTPEQIVTLTAFGAIMLATNVFNNALAGGPRRLPRAIPVRGHRSEGGGRLTARFEGKVAFITGAAHGQGRASALALAREGASIAALDVARPLAYPGYALGTPEDLASLSGECRALGVECLTFAADVRDDARGQRRRRRRPCVGSVASTSCSTTPESAPTASRTN